MRILLTGHTGFVGSRLTKELKKGHEAYGFDCGTYQEFEEAFRAFKRRGVKFDLFLHCGAISDSQRTDNLLWQMNYQASCEIADYCERTDTRLIYISSAAAIDPNTPYGWSKRCAEFYMNQRVAGMNLCILRPFNIWGDDESEKASPSIIYKILTNQLPVIYTPCRRDFVHVDDIVAAILQVIEDWRPGTFSLGTGIPTDIIDLCSNIGLCNKPEIPVEKSELINPDIVADPKDILPNWCPTPITEYIEVLSTKLLNR